MLVARPIGEDGHRYYLAQIGHNGQGELPGRWVGAAAQRIGLGAEVDGGDLGRVLQGRDPGGEPLVVRRRARVAGVDLIFAAPKSFSLAHGLGSPEMAEHVRAAHDLAVDGALEFLQRSSAVVRQGPSRRAAADGLVAAAFRHRVSRADDPHLHTHVLVANMAPGPTGRWSALHTPLLFSDLRTVDALYRAAFRYGLSESLGWGCADNGVERGELLGISRAMIEAFSRRHAQIVVATEELDGRSRLAADLTRPPRHELIDHEALRAQWRQRADQIGLPLPAPRIRESREKSTAVSLPGSDNFSRSDVIRGCCALLPDGAPPTVVEKVADRSLVTAVPVPCNRTGPGSARLDGPRGPAPRYTTSDVLRARREVADLAGVELATVAGTPGPSLRDAFRPHRPGVLLLGASSSSYWAQRFERSTGIVCGSLGAVSHALHRWPLGKGPVILVEHGHRVATLELAALARCAIQTGGSVVLLADPDRRRWSETFALLAQRRGIAHVLECQPTTLRKDPPQIAGALGRAPSSLVARCRWREAAEALTAYRERWRITDDRPLGGPPVSAEQRTDRRQVERSMALAIGLTRRGPDRALTR